MRFILCIVFAYSLTSFVCRKYLEERIHTCSVFASKFYLQIIFLFSKEWLIICKQETSSVLHENNRKTPRVTAHTLLLGISANSVHLYFCPVIHLLIYSVIKFYLSLTRDLCFVRPKCGIFR